MKRCTLILLAFAAANATAQESTTAPQPATLPATTSAVETTTAPATAPTSAPATFPMESRRSGQSSLVDVVRAKSIFSKDRQPPRRWSSGNDRPSQSWTPRPRLPVLIGVARAEKDLVAVIELPDQNKVVEVRPGERLPNDAGVIEGITLDQIEIAAAPGGPSQPVKVGQDLRGAAPEPATSATAAATGPAGAAPTGSIEGDDPLSRMRRRRMQEMNR